MSLVTLSTSDVFKDSTGAPIANGVLILRLGDGSQNPLIAFTSTRTPAYIQFNLDVNGKLTGTPQIYGSDQVNLPYYWEVFRDNTFVGPPALVGPIDGQLLNTTDSQPISLLIHATAGINQGISGQGFQPGVIGAVPSAVSGTLALKPFTADAIQFVSVEGNDANDGLSWGSAKATIAAAIAALPSVTYLTRTWNHAGTVKIGAGSFTVSSTINIISPFIIIEGQGTVATRILFTGTTGACFDWTSSAFNSDQPDTFGGGLRNLTIDGTGASAGTQGIHTYDVVGIYLDHIAIGNFAGAGSVGWWHDAKILFGERFQANIEIANCTTCWNITAQSGAMGYPYTTLGYGRFRLWLNPNASQIAVASSNCVVTFSEIFIVVNGGAASAIAFKLVNSKWLNNLYAFHAEGTSGMTGISVDATSALTGVGSWHEQSGLTDSITAGGYVNIWGFNRDDNGNSPSIWPAILTGGTNLLIGALSDIAGNAAISIGLPSGASNWPLICGLAGSLLAAIDVSGALRLAGATPTVSAGQIGIGKSTATSATAGSNGDVPAQVVGYLEVNIGGTFYKIPYYAA